MTLESGILIKKNKSPDAMYAYRGLLIRGRVENTDYFLPVRNCVKKTKDADSSLMQYNSR